MLAKNFPERNAAMQVSSGVASRVRGEEQESKGKVGEVL